MNVKTKYVIAKVITYVFYQAKKHKRDPRIAPFEYGGNYLFNLIGGKEKKTFRMLMDLPEFSTYLKSVVESSAFVMCEDEETANFYYAGEFLESAEYMRLNSLVECILNGETAHLYTTKADDELCVLESNDDSYLSEFVYQFYCAFPTHSHTIPDYRYERKLARQLSLFGATGLEWFSSTDAPEEDGDKEPTRCIKFKFEGFDFIHFGYK